MKRAVFWGCLLLACANRTTTAAENQSERWPRNYGNAPDELVPFRRVEPYTRYFTSPQPFRGPGRDYPPAAGLSSLRIGLLNPSPAGSERHRGAMTKKGVELALAEANAAAALGDLPFELIVREDSPQWGSAANIMVDFASKDEVLGVIGTVDGDATHVALRVALKVETYIVNTSDPDPTLTETNIPWLLRVFPDDRQQGYRLADLIVRQRGCRKIVLLRVNNRYGRVGVRVFMDSVRRLGFPVLQEMRYEAGDRVFSTPVERIRAAEPDAVVFWGEPEDLGHAAVALRQAGVTAAFFGCDRLFSPEFIRIAGPAAEGTALTYPFNPRKTDPAWKLFTDRFRAAYEIDPDIYAGYAFDGANLLVEAIRKVGPNRYRIRDYLAELQEHHGVTGHMRFDGTLNNLPPLAIARIQQGQFEFLEPEAPAATRESNLP